MSAVILAVIVCCFLAYSNGGNDNFKGVATLYGSGALTYKKALWLATVGQMLGSLAAITLAQSLAVSFSGKGLVPDSLVALSSFQQSVGFAAAATVFLATWFGFPISTTHALLGGMVGAALIGDFTGINYARLLDLFTPLLLSPVIAIAVTLLLYSLAVTVSRGLGGKFVFSLNDNLGSSEKLCVCVSQNEWEGIGSLGPSMSGAALTSLSCPVHIGTVKDCQDQGLTRALSFSPDKLLAGVHGLSGGVVCFARGLNDTPKITAVLMATKAISPEWGLSITAIAMMIGGLVQSKRIAELLSKKVTVMNPLQGLAANLTTSALVVTGALKGWPLSTTHVSVGSLFGLNLVQRKANYKILLGIAAAWATTLPIAAAFGALLYWAFRSRGG